MLICPFRCRIVDCAAGVGVGDDADDDDDDEKWVLVC